MSARRPAALIAAMCVAAFLSCGEDSVTNADPKYSRSTPEDLVDALACSIKHRDIDVYDECLHDEYLFIFESFAAEFLELPEDEPWWAKPDDVSAISDVFNNPAVIGIECAIEVDTGPWPTDEGLGYRLIPDMVFTATRYGDWEGQTLPIQDSWFLVEIVVDPYADDKWVFKAIEEVYRDLWLAGSDPGREVMTYSTTFGLIKAIYGR